MLILLGSIMKFNLTPAAREWVASLVAENEAAALVVALTEQYDALVMNPPYMGGGNMNEVLSKYVKKNYEDGKGDLANRFCRDDGTTYINSWSLCLYNTSFMDVLKYFRRLAKEHYQQSNY